MGTIRRSSGGELSANPKRLVESDSSFSQELITQEHVPYHVNLMNAVDGARRAISFSDDGGVGGVLALYSILEDRLRKRFPGLEEKLHEALRTRVVNVRTGTRKEYLDPSDPMAFTRTQWDTETQSYKEKQRFFHSYKPIMAVREVYVYALSDRRKFASQTLQRIIDVLNAEGLLWDTKSEIVGGER